VISHVAEFGENSTVNLEKFFRGGSIKEEHLESTNFETFTEDVINNLSDLVLSDNMGLYDSTCTVIE